MSFPENYQETDVEMNNVNELNQAVRIFKHRFKETIPAQKDNLWYVNHQNAEQKE